MVIILIIIVTLPIMIITIITRNQESSNKCCHIRQWQFSISFRARMDPARKYFCERSKERTRHPISRVM